jgi:two-component system chemotaxis response regulator CheV
MASILDSVNQRTQLVGQNRLELLLFKLNGRQRYGINVFKVREVLQCPPLTSMPKLNSFVKGIAHIRGQTISVIDMGLATGGRPIKNKVEDSFIIITEYNRTIQGFLVDSVERIVNLNWDSVMPPPSGSGRSNYLTAVTEIDDDLVEILDVEKVLEEIAPSNTQVSSDTISDQEIMKDLGDRTILIVDDSSVARNQVKRALEGVGLPIVAKKNGKEALDYLVELGETCEHSVTEKIGLMISDVEMPVMDGYTLTAEVKSRPKLAALHVILHTSLSGVFNHAMVEKVGADDFIAKFNPDELAGAVQKWLHEE